jgi:hypothetical protein
VNTLARMEYVGLRKMLKSRHSTRLDVEGLQHVLDEAAHALRLKKAAVALAAGRGVETFAAGDTLAGDEGEAYLQGVDRAAEEALADTPAGTTRTEANYVLTSGAIEVRAQAFYPLYDRCLRASGAPFSVAAIQRDEDRHLAEMTASLERLLGDGWRARLEAVLATELTCFDLFVGAVERVTQQV